MNIAHYIHYIGYFPLLYNWKVSNEYSLLGAIRAQDGMVLCCSRLKDAGV